MKTARYLLVAAVTLAACAPPAPPPPDVAAITKAIEAANANSAAGMLKGDAAGFAVNYVAESKVLMPGAPIMNGKDEVIKAVTAMLADMTTTKFEPKTVGVTVVGDYAIEDGTYTWTMKPKKGKEATEVGKYLTVWHKQADGSWKIFRDMNNADGPAK